MNPQDAGLSEIARFLALRAPFDSLAPEELGEVAAQTEIEFHPAGAVILSEDGGPVTFLRVIHSGAVDIVHEGTLLDMLASGDAFGQAAMLAGLPPGVEARAAEDTLCYRVPAAVARPLLDRARERELKVGVLEPGHQSVATLIRAPAVVCEPMTPIREVARRMTEAGTSSAVVRFSDGAFGIVTDRDLRSKIVAGGLPLSAPAAAAMSVPAHSVTPDRLGGEVLFEMLQRGIHHMLVVSGPGQLVGVVEDSDLFAVHPRSWFGVRRAIARALDGDALAAAARSIPELLVDLHASNLRALEVAHVLSALTDALTVRALELAAKSVQLPRDGLVWVAVGSQARRELTPASIPGGAVVASDPPPQEWGRVVGELLQRSGIPNAVVARSAQEWRSGDVDDELTLTVLVERRALWGTPREPMPLAQNGIAQRVLDSLVRRALAYDPPTGFDGGAVLGADGTRDTRLDIRRAAVIPVVELARWAGAAVGVNEGSTVERLRAGASGGALSEADARTLADVFELALELRLSHQMEQLAAGLAPDDMIDPVALSPLARDHLRDVFRAVAGVQRKLRK